MISFLVYKILLLYFIIYQTNQKELLSINEILNSIFENKINFTEYKNICKETIKYNHNQCFTLSIKYEEIISNNLLSTIFKENGNIETTNNSSNINFLNETNKEKISYIYYNLGNIYYHGHISKEPNLPLGLTFFIISTFFGSAESKYMLSIILSNNLFEQIYLDKNFQKLLISNNILQKISKSEFFHNNFDILINYTKNKLNNNNNNDNKRILSQKIDEYHNNLALSFLFSSALQNYIPSKLLLGYKLEKGYGIEFSCSYSIKYYIDVAKDSIKQLNELNKKIFYDYKSLEEYEYIGNKFKENNMKDEKSIVDLYWNQITNKKDESNLQIIKELAKIYYYGSSGVQQNFETSFFLFNKAIELNDNESYFYLGEQYLNGWGVPINYTKAFELFNKSITDYNNTYSWNSLGYMYYYGLGVEKNIKKAYDYFNIGITYKDTSAYYDMAYLLIQNKNDKIKDDNNKILNEKSVNIDYEKAYKYASTLAAKDLSFGNYFYAMMNQYSIGSVISSCNINIGFFKTISEKSLYIKYLFDLAFDYYKKKMFRKAFLIYLELAEMGMNVAQINSALLLNNYHIFIDKNFQKFLTYKFYFMAYKNGNNLASLKLGDFFYSGFGSLKPNIKKSKKYYELSKNIDIFVDSFKLAHANFNLGMIYLFKENSTNKTNDTYMANFYFNKSENQEMLTFYPAEFVKKYDKWFDLRNNYTIKNVLKKLFIDKILKKIFNKKVFHSIEFFFILFSGVLYVLFFISLKKQKE